MQAIVKAHKLEAMDIDPTAQCHGLELLAVGLPRCATSSLHTSLEDPTLLDLGPTLHMKRIIPSPGGFETLEILMKETDPAKRQKLLRKLCAGCRSAADWPVHFYADELMDLYPDAKIVLNHRPGPVADRGRTWAESARGAFGFFSTPAFFYIGLLIPSLRIFHRVTLVSYDTLARQTGLVQVGEGTSFDWLTPELYYRYSEWVKGEAAKRGRPVLEWDPSMGWEPLCAFLGRDVPKGGAKFPHVNDAAEVRMIRRSVILVGAASWAALGGLCFASLRYGPGLVSRAISLWRK